MSRGKNYCYKGEGILFKTIIYLPNTTDEPES